MTKDFSSKSVSTELHVSEATLTRFAQKCDYSGYREFVYAYSNNHGVNYSSQHNKNIQRVLYDYNQILDKTYSLIDIDQIERFVQRITAAKRIYIYGKGSSGIAATEIKYRFMRMGISIEAITDDDLMLINHVVLDEDCVVIGFSISGQSSAVTNALRQASELGIYSVLFTTQTNSAQNEFANEIFSVASLQNFSYGNRISPQFPLLVLLDIIFDPLFWYTSLGGVEVVAGEAISGAQNIYFAQLADPNHTGLFTYGTRFFAGRFATMMFGLPAATLGMYHAIPKANRAENGGFYLSSALTSFLTGLTEPIEFSFLFAAPWLYVVHAFLDGVSFFVADLLQIRIGNTFSGGLIDFLLFGPFQGNAQTNWILVIPMGIVWGFVYYFVFRTLVKRFNVAVPGMEVNIGETPKQNADKGGSLQEQALVIIEALGTEANIEDVTACATRLRVAVSDVNQVNKEVLKGLGATAVLEVQNGIQAIYGGNLIYTVKKLTKF